MAQSVQRQQKALPEAILAAIAPRILKEIV